MRSNRTACLFVCALLFAGGSARAEDKAGDEKAAGDEAVDEKSAASPGVAEGGAGEKQEAGARVLLILDRDLGLDPGRCKELRQALSFELNIRSLALVEPGVGAEDDAMVVPEEERSDKEQNARRRLIESGARAALWLQAGYAGPVTWLRAVTDRDDRVLQAPLPHPPQAIDPKLFAIAAASLLEQVLEGKPEQELEPAAPETDEQKTKAYPSRDGPAEAAPVPAQADTSVAAEWEAPEKVHPTSAEKPQKRFFANIGLVLGLSAVHSGMKTDTPPPGGAENIYVIDDPDSDQYLTLRNDTPWVADADSWERNPEGQDGTTDEFRKNPNQECPADGRVSGPDWEAFESIGYPYYPTSYCARVESAGLVVSSPVMRLEIGYFVLRRLSLAAILRYQFAAGEGALSHWLLGGRVGYLLTAPESRLSWTVFGGITTGQIQPRPPVLPGNTNSPRPSITSGPTGIHAGSAVGWWFDEHFGVRLAPEIDVQLSRELWHLDVTAGLMSRF